MADAPKPRIFVDGLIIRSHQFANGGTNLNVSVKVDEMIAWLNKHRRESGWCKLVIAERRNPDERSTHYAYLDTWEPKPKTQADTPATASANPPPENPDNLPF